MSQIHCNRESYYFHTWYSLAHFSSQSKVMCTKWYMGTGGGDGQSTFFEDWDDAKLWKYNINVIEYNHSDVSQRPSILIDCYHTNYHPYFTMIFLWDQMVDNLLSLQYDPLHVGNGEACILSPYKLFF